MLAKVIAVPEVNAFHKNGGYGKCTVGVVIVLVTGFISRAELGRIFGPRSHVTECINLMQKFEVLFELDNSRYLIPSMLPPSEAQSCVVFPRSLRINDLRSADKLSSGPAIPMGSHSNCLVRFFMLPFIPNGMFPRLSARLIATDVIEHVLSLLKITSFADDQHYINRPHWRVWRYGITLIYRHMQIFRIVPMDIPLPGVDVVHVIQPKELLQSGHCNVYKGISIMVQVDKLPDNAFSEKSSGLQMATWLLQQAVEQINSVFEDWYEEFAWKRSIDVSVVAADPCPQCMSVVYEQLAPDQYAAQRRLVDEPRAMEEAKKDKKLSFLRTMTLSRKPPSKIKRSTSETLDVSYGTMKRPTPYPSWSSGRLYGMTEKVLYLFSVKLSALSVMESTALTCPTHGAISINQIAPDMVCCVCVCVCSCVHACVRECVCVVCSVCSV